MVFIPLICRLLPQFYFFSDWPFITSYAKARLCTRNTLAPVFLHTITSLYVLIGRTGSPLVSQYSRDTATDNALKNSLNQTGSMPVFVCVLVFMSAEKTGPGSNWFQPWGAVCCLQQRTPRNRVTVTDSSRQRRKGGGRRMLCDARSSR